jgi:microcystin-dependent protein
MIDGKLLYPIGSIYMSIQDTNPSVFFGGTWERIAKGKTLVGVDESDTDFNASSKTGGEKTHILTVDETPSHTHTLANNRGSGNQSWGGLTGVSKVDGVTYDRATTSSTGGDQPHNNLQPYYTCYIFVRTA